VVPLFFSFPPNTKSIYLASSSRLRVPNRKSKLNTWWCKGEGSEGISSCQRRVEKLCVKERGEAVCKGESVRPFISCLLTYLPDLLTVTSALLYYYSKSSKEVLFLTWPVLCALYLSPLIFLKNEISISIKKWKQHSLLVVLLLFESALWRSLGCADPISLVIQISVFSDLRLRKGIVTATQFAR